MDSSSASESAVGSGTSQRLLEQASEIAGHLQTQVSELDRRESSLNSQLSQLDQERRSGRLAVRQEQESLEARAEDLSRRERQLEQGSEELSLRGREIESSCQQLAARKESLSADVQSELDLRRDKLEVRSEELVARAATQDAEHSARLKQLEADLARRGDELREEVTERVIGDELRARRKQLDRDQDEWKRRVESQRLELERKTSEHDRAVRLFDAERSERESGQEQELALNRRSQERELEEVGRSFAAEQESARSELQQERALMENRHLFQQEHLAKVRSMLEVDQAVFRKEVQDQRADLERRLQMLDGLRRQLAHCRGLLEEREALVEEGLSSLQRRTRAAEESLNLHQQRLATSRENWRKTREEQRQEVSGLREHLRSESRALESRKQRIEVLREELEGSHRESLELRLAVEESLESYRAEQGREGDDVATVRLEAARDAVEGHYRQMRETLQTQRTDLEDAQKQLIAQVTQQQKVYVEHGERLVERERVIGETEEELRRQIAEVPSGESHWDQMQTRWIAEKDQAERIIRDLLKQLGETPAA